MNIIVGSYRKLTAEEKEKYSDFSLVITEEYIYECDDKKIIVPVGFLSDGATWAPDLGCSWIFHDYLYATHKYCNDILCTFDEANKIMANILAHEKRHTYRYLFLFTLEFDIGKNYQKAWDYSFLRGPIFMAEKIEENTLNKI